MYLRLLCLEEHRCSRDGRHRYENRISDVERIHERPDPVEVVVDSRPGHIEVSVLDRGAGWPEVVRTHLGQPFVTTKPDGVGLGLYYVHTLAEAVGAHLFVEDRSEGGAIARLSIPSVGAAAEVPR